VIAALLLTGASLAAPPNLMLISIDGMRADRAGFHGATPSPTPSLDRLVDDALICDLSLSQSNESLFSHAALLAGKHVSELGRPDYSRFTVADDVMLLPEILGLYGYSTGGFVAGGHVKGGYGFNQGYGTWYDDPDFGAFFHTVPVALDWLDTQALQPWFVFLHGYDAHRPYQHFGLFFHVFGRDYDGDVDVIGDRTSVEKIIDGVFYEDFPIEFFWHQGVGDKILDPAGYQRLRDWATDHEGKKLSAVDLQHLKDHYDSGVLSADLQVGRVMDHLKATGQWDHSLVVITADHGEDMGDHGTYNHRSSLADSATRVPLMITGGALPEHLRGTRIPGPCEALDVVPTMLAAAGAVPPAGLEGHDLLTDPTGHDVVIQEGVLPMLAVRSPTHRLLVSGIPLDTPLLQLLVQSAPIQAPTFQLFDLVADPTETVDVLDEQMDVALELRAALLQWLTDREASEHLGQQPLDPEFRAILQSRGYW